MGKEKMGEKQVSENARGSDREREMGREVESTFEAAAYLAQGFDEAWQREVLRRGV